MAPRPVTHADLAPAPKSSSLGSKTGAFLMVLSILLGLFCFILCLIAEAARSEVLIGFLANPNPNVLTLLVCAGEMERLAMHLHRQR